MLMKSANFPHISGLKKNGRIPRICDRKKGLNMRLKFNCRIFGFFRICEQFSPALCGIFAYATATVSAINIPPKVVYFSHMFTFTAAYMRQVCDHPNSP